MKCYRKWRLRIEAWFLSIALVCTYLTVPAYAFTGFDSGTASASNAHNIEKSTASNGREDGPDASHKTYRKASSSNAAALRNQKIYYLNWNAESPEKDYNYEVLDADGQPVDQTWWDYYWNDELDGWNIQARNVQYSYDQIEYQYCLFEDGELIGEIPASIDHRPVVGMIHCFSGSPLVTAPTIPETVMDLSYAFENTNITAMPQIHEGITNLDHTFEYCWNLKEVTPIPASVKSVNYTFASSGIEETPKFKNLEPGYNELFMTFAHCKDLRLVNTLPNVESLNGTFYDSFIIGYDAADLVIPEKVVDMNSSFRLSHILAPPKLPKGIKNIDYAFDGCGSLKTTPLLPEGLESANHAFSHCYSIEFTDGSDYIVLPGSLIDVQDMFTGTFDRVYRQSDAYGRYSQLIFFQDREHYHKVYDKSFNKILDWFDQYGDEVMIEGAPAGGVKEILTVAPRICSQLVLHNSKRALKVTFLDYYEKSEDNLSNFHDYPMDTIEYRINGQGDFIVWDSSPLYLYEDTYIEARKQRNIETYEGTKHITTETREKQLKVEQPDTPELQAKYLGGGLYEVRIIYWNLLRSLDQVELFYQVNDGEIKSVDNYGTVTIHCEDTLTAWADWGAVSDTVSYTAPDYVKWIVFDGLQDSYYGDQSIPVMVNVGEEDAGDKTYDLSIISGSAARLVKGELVNIGTGEITLQAKAKDGSGVTAEKKIDFLGKYIPVTNISMALKDGHSNTINLSENVDLVVTIGPGDAINQEYYYTVDNSTIFTIDGDTIKPLQCGTATITAHAADNPFTTASLKVEIVTNMESLDLQDVPLVAFCGEQFPATVYFSPMEYGSHVVLAANSEDIKIQEQMQGYSSNLYMIIPEKPGIYTLTASSDIPGDPATDSSTFTVINRVENVKILSETNIVETGKKLQLDLLVDPADAELTWQWESSDSDILTVDENGNLTGITPGTSTITVYGQEQPYIRDSKEFTVILPPPDYVTELHLSGKTEMEVNEEQTLTLQKLPADSAAPILWEISNDAAQITQEGHVTAIKPGTFTVTVSDQKRTVTDTLEIMVVDRVHTEVTIEAKSGIIESEDENVIYKNMAYGKQAVLEAKVTTLNPDKTVTWSSSDPTIAEITQDGIMTPKKNGIVEITAGSNNGSGAKAVYRLRVTTAVEWIDAEVKGSCEALPYEQGFGSIIHGGTTITVHGVYPEDAEYDYLNLRFYSENSEQFKFTDGQLTFQEDTRVSGYVDSFEGYMECMLQTEGYMQPCKIYTRDSLSHYRLVDPSGKYSLLYSQLEPGYEVEIYDCLEARTLSFAEVDERFDSFSNIQLTPLENHIGDFLPASIRLIKRDGSLYLICLPDIPKQEAVFNASQIESGQTYPKMHFESQTWKIVSTLTDNFNFKLYDKNDQESDTIEYIEERDKPQIIETENGPVNLKGENYLELRIYEDGEEIINPSAGFPLQAYSNTTPCGYKYQINIYNQYGTSCEPVFALDTLQNGRLALYGLVNGSYRICIKNPNGKKEYHDLKVTGATGITQLSFRDTGIPEFRGNTKLYVDFKMGTELGLEGFINGTSISPAIFNELEVHYELADKQKCPYLHLKDGKLSCDGMCPDRTADIIVSIYKSKECIAQAASKCYISGQLPTPNIRVHEQYNFSPLEAVNYNQDFVVECTAYGSNEYDLSPFLKTEWTAKKESSVLKNLVSLGSNTYQFEKESERAINEEPIKITYGYKEDALRYFTNEDKNSGQYVFSAEAKFSLPADYICQMLLPSKTIEVGETMDFGASVYLNGERQTYYADRQLGRPYMEINVEDSTGHATFRNIESSNLYGDEKVFSISAQKKGTVKIHMKYYKLSTNSNEPILEWEDSQIVTITQGVKSVQLKERNQKKQVFEGEKAYFYLEYLPSDADGKNHYFELVDDITGSTIDSDTGEFTAGSSGTVTVKGSNGKDSAAYDLYQLEIKKRPVYANKITVEPNASTIFNTDTLQLTAAVLPAHAEDKDIEWRITNENVSSTVAFITPTGLFLPNQTGEYHVRASLKSNNTIYADAVITVETLPVSIAISGGNEMGYDDTMKLDADVYPEDANNKQVIWEIIKNPELAEISLDGTVLSKSELGKITVQATVKGTDIKDSIDISIGKPIPDLEVSVKDKSGQDKNEIIDNEQLYLYVNGQLCTEKERQEKKYQVSVLPANQRAATSNNAKGLILDPNGRILGTMSGLYLIAISQEVDGYQLKAQQPIKVSKTKQYDTLHIYPEDGSYQMGCMATKQMAALLQPELDGNDVLIWSIEENTDAKINQNGLLNSADIEQIVTVQCTIRSNTGKDYLSQSCKIKISKELPPDPDQNPDPTPEPDPMPNPDPMPEPDPMPNPDPMPDPDPMPEPDPAPNPEPTPNPDPMPEPDDPTPDPVPNPIPDPVLPPTPPPVPNPKPIPDLDPTPNPPQPINPNLSTSIVSAIEPPQEIHKTEAGIINLADEESKEKEITYKEQTFEKLPKTGDDSDDVIAVYIMCLFLMATLLVNIYKANKTGEDSSK